MTAELWDVVIIGGGPAGCAAAVTLASRGVRAALLEAKTYPHDKMCGEFLSPEVPSLLDRLGMGRRFLELNPTLIDNVRLSAPDGTVWEARLPGQALGLSRKTLDAALADRARQSGAALFERAPVEAVRGSAAEGFTIRVGNGLGELRARAVIAAHGKRGALDRELNRAFLRRRSPFVAIKAHFHGPPIPGRVELHAFPGGYCGMSEIEGGLKVVCLLAHERAFARAQGPGGLDGFLAWMMAQNPYLGGWLRGAERIHPRWITIAQVPFGPKTAREGDALMAGDAAGLIVPLAGDGIAMALEGGMFAADQLFRLLTGEVSAADLRAQYPAMWKKRFGGRLRLGRAVQPLLLSPRGVSLGLRAFRLFPALGSSVIRGTRGMSVWGEQVQTDWKTHPEVK